MVDSHMYIYMLTLRIIIAFDKKKPSHCVPILVCITVNRKLAHVTMQMHSLDYIVGIVISMPFLIIKNVHMHAM